MGLARGVALFTAGFCLLNVLGASRRVGFDANLLLMDVRWLPEGLATSLLVIISVVFLAFGIRPSMGKLRRQMTLGCAGLMALIALVNSVEFFWLLLTGGIASAFPVPFTLLCALGWGLIARAAVKQPSECPVASLLGPAFYAVCLALLFPLLQMFCFGKTDYRRPADTAVVFGARVYEDGRPSDALADRVRTACQLYNQGTVRHLIFSGGPGDGRIHETESMKTMAIGLGVKAEDIQLDYNGLNTRKTVENTLRMLRGSESTRMIVVSHFYHLPRIKLAYQRAGWEVYTVPAHESYILRQLPFNMAREVAAYWAYYLRPPQAAG
jgi:uncharacterized SAM-binding protein YcdF (DUF218 family)